MSKSILIIRSNPVAPDPRVEKTARSLSKQGYSVDILCWARFGGLPLEEEKNEYRIYRREVLADFGSGLKNLPYIIRWQWEEFRWLITNGKEYDVYHACDFDTVLPALGCKILFGNKMVYDIFDFYADHLRRTPNWIKSIIRGVDLFVIGRAECVILTDESRIQQIAGSRPKHLSIIFNSPEDVYQDGQQVKNASAKKMEQSIRIVYVGLLQQERGLLELLQLLKTHPDWKLDLAGFGGNEDEIESKANDLPNVHFYGRIDYAEALGLGAQADLFYALYDPSIRNHKYASPNKVFEAMMLRKPVLVAHDTNADVIVSTWNFGRVVSYHRLDEIENAISELAESPSLRTQLGKNGRHAYESKYSWKQMEKELIEVYTRLL